MFQDTKLFRLLDFTFRDRTSTNITTCLCGSDNCFVILSFSKRHNTIVKYVSCDDCIDFQKQNFGNISVKI